MNTAPARIVAQFSCGAASAVATKIALAQHKGAEVQIVNAFVKEEEDDNRRFLADCEGWFGQRALQLRDEKYGASAEEADRFDDFRERNPQLSAIAPLVDAGIGKADCLAMVRRAGIELPLAYRQGYSNANCIGCPKGGEGYWNNVRKVHPLVFRARMERQESIGPGAYFFRDRETGERFGLKDLDPTAGRHDEPMPACSFFCELAEQEYAA